MTIMLFSRYLSGVPLRVGLFITSPRSRYTPLWAFHCYPSRKTLYPRFAHGLNHGLGYYFLLTNG